MARGGASARPRDDVRICRRGHVVEGRNRTPHGRCRQCTRVSVDAENGVECLICGDILRKLAMHLKTHGLNAKEYRRRFPGAPTAGPQYRKAKRADYNDMITDGRLARSPKKKMCKHGHILWGRNIYIDANGHRHCRKCNNKARRARNLERQRAYEREWYAKNRDAQVERQREHYANNREARLEWQRKYYARNREKILAKQRERRAKKQEGA